MNWAVKSSMSKGKSQGDNSKSEDIKETFNHQMKCMTLTRTSEYICRSI